ncbi:MAG: methyl-accepting chemotaxis protein, partial [bacterium]
MSRLETKILGVILFVFILGCIISIFVVVYLQKTALYEISSIRVSETAEIIARNLERSMVEGKAEVTRAMVNDYRTSKGIEEVNVYNHEGREAFTTGGSLQEQETVAALQRDKDTEVLEQDGALYIYKPLLNTPLCQSCHGTDKTLLGAIKIVVPLAKEDEKVASLFGISIGASVVVIIGLSTLMIVILRRLVIRPVEAIERAATMLSDGDLSFSVTIKSRDEIGRMSRAMRSSLVSISSVLRKVQDVSQRISKVAGIVEHESRKILEGTQLESEAIENISSAVEELNASITEISESTDSLAASVEETAASMEQMSVSITQITQSTLSLFTAVEETSSSIEEMSSTIKAVAESSDKLSGTSEDTFSAIEELNISIREVDRNAKESSALSHRVVEDATKNGLQSVEKTVEGMERIKQAVEKAAELIRRLGDRSEEIGKILTVIDEITEQTTLLSLNA